MAALRKDDEASISRVLHLDSRDADHPGAAAAPDAAGSREDLERLKQLLAFSARQMGDLRSRNEQLMAVNSDLRCKLGEMTLRWVDLSNRTGR